MMRLQGLTSLEKSLTLRATFRNFHHFFMNCFSKGIEKVEGLFIRGNHFKDWCDFMQFNNWTGSIGPRKHGKTMCKVLGYCAWRIWQTQERKRPYYEMMIISNIETLAARKIAMLNRLIDANPDFDHFKRMTTAEGIAHYKVNGNEIIIYPAGIGSANRSVHPDEVHVTDPHSDPDKKVSFDPVEIIKDSQVFRRAIMNFPKEGGMLHCEGTRMSSWDIFGYISKSKLFQYREDEAIIDYSTKEILWPEYYTFDRLMSIKEDGPEDFEQEYQGVPIRSTQGYITQDELDQVINPDLKPIDFNVPIGTKKEIRGGYDLGKKAHPSHISVFSWDGSGKKTQLLSLWMDRMDYSVQVETVTKIIKNLKVDSMRYDNTRGELEGLMEIGALPQEMEPVLFNVKTKHSMARALGTAVRRGEIELLDDPRQTAQILNCDSELRSEDTSDGHGDSFWTNAMAMESFCVVEPQIRWL